MHILQILTTITQFNKVNKKKKLRASQYSELTVNICMYKHQNVFRVI